MALTVGTDAYDTLANIRSYWADRGDTAWALLADADAEVYIRKATDYVDRKWDYIGDKATSTQRLKWPRENAEVEGFTLDDSTIPWQVEEATAIVAEMFRVGTYDMDGILTDSTASIIREKVDVIEVEYDAGQRLQGGDIASNVIELLRPLISSSGRLLRA